MAKIEVGKWYISDKDFIKVDEVFIFKSGVKKFRYTIFPAPSKEYSNYFYEESVFAYNLQETELSSILEVLYEDL